MNYRALTLGALLGFVLAVSHSCGGGEKCDANSCPTGCCDSAGACVTRTTVDQCGTNGDSCGVCPTGASCAGGVCTGPSGGGGGDGGCASTNATGCCTPNGTPLPGDSNTSCGSGGIPCGDCTKLGPAYGCFDPDGPNGSELRACRPIDGGSAAGLIGSACTSSSECISVPVVNPANRICKTETTFGNLPYPDGYCTRACYQDSHCGTGGLCVYGLGEIGEADNICLDRCSSNAECRPGYACLNFGTDTNPVGACWLVPPDGGFPAVDAGPGANPGVMGNSCSVNATCQPPSNGGCIPEILPDGGASGYTGGSCTAECTYGGDAYCGTGGICILYLFGSTAETSVIAGLCEAQCSPSASTCRAGYYCDAVTTTLGYCSPRCDVVGGGCPTQFTCNTTNGACCNSTGCL